MRRHSRGRAVFWIFRILHRSSGPSIHSTRHTERPRHCREQHDARHHDTKLSRTTNFHQGHALVTHTQRVRTRPTLTVRGTQHSLLDRSTRSMCAYVCARSLSFHTQHAQLPINSWHAPSLRNIEHREPRKRSLLFRRRRSRELYRQRSQAYSVRNFACTFCFHK